MLLCDVDYGAERARDFMEFVHRCPDELIVATDLLTTCRRKGRPWSDITGYYCGTLPIPLGVLMTAVRFLTEQRLLVRTYKRPDSWGYRESVLKAAPRALDELMYRLEHDGEPSPVPDPNLPRLAARRRLDATLASVGFRDRGGTRLRAVK